MDVALQYFDGCPNWRIPDERLMLLAAQRPAIALTRQRVDRVEEAERARFRGSPSILVAGVDVFADGSPPVGLAYRRYMTQDGPAGAPSIEQIRVHLPKISGPDL